MQELQEQITREPPPERIETPHGALFRPKHAAVQALVLAAVFAAGIGAGWLPARLGGLSENGGTFFAAALTAILFLGYGLWMARLRAIVFAELGKGILWSLICLIVKRKRPASLEDVLPTREKLERMAVRAQRAASSFFVVAFPIAAVAGLGAALFLSQPALWLRASLLPAACILWGALLARLARRGWLPILEEGG